MREMQVHGSQEEADDFQVSSSALYSSQTFLCRELRF